MVNLELTKEQASGLKSLLVGSLGDMSAESADTATPRFRASLVQRRQQLTEVAEDLTCLVDVDEAPTEFNRALPRAGRPGRLMASASPDRWLLGSLPRPGSNSWFAVTKECKWRFIDRGSWSV